MKKLFRFAHRVRSISTVLVLGALSGAAHAGDAPKPQQKSTPISIPIIEVGAVTQSALLAGLRAGTLSAESAWNSGTLDAVGALRLIESGAVSGEADEKVRVGLIGALQRHAPDALPKTGDLVAAAQKYLDAKEAPAIDKSAPSALLRRAIADALGAGGDERAVPLWKQLAREGAHESYATGLIYKRIAYFWRERNQTEKAVAAWSEARAFLVGKQKRFAGEMLLETAREWGMAGQSDKANEIYARIPADGDDSISGAALFDQARALAGKGKSDEVLKLLAAADTWPDEHWKALLLSYRAIVLMRQEKLPDARRAMDAALAVQKSIREPRLKYSVIVDSFRTILEDRAAWETMHFRVETKALVVSRAEIERATATNRPIVLRLRVRTWGDVPLRVESSDTGVAARIAGGWDEATSEGDEREKEVIAEIRPGALRAGAKVTLTLRGEKVNERVVVPVRVEA